MPGIVVNVYNLKTGNADAEEPRDCGQPELQSKLQAGLSYTQLAKPEDLKC